MGKKTAALLIQPRSTQERAFIESLLKRLGMMSHPLTEDEVLDLGLSQMMRRVDRSKRVDPRTAMKILAS